MEIITSTVNKAWKFSISDVLENGIQKRIGRKDALEINWMHMKVFDPQKNEDICGQYMFNKLYVDSHIEKLEYKNDNRTSQKIYSYEVNSINIDQMRLVEERLKQKTNERSDALIIISNPYVDLIDKWGAPCLMSMHFHFESGKLSLTSTYNESNAC